MWLSPEESEIYLLLLKQWKKSISDISKILIINRPKLYRIIPNMIESGLICEVLHWKRKLLKAENPKLLKNLFQKVEEDYELMIPVFEDMYWKKDSGNFFKHSKGKTAVKNIFLDIANSLEKDWIFYRYSSRKDVENTSLPSNDYSKYKKIRDEKWLQRMVITNEYLDSLKENKLWKDVVVIPKWINIFEENFTKIIYANKVVIIDYSSWECLTIENQTFANFERNLFLMLFKMMKKNKYA